MGATFYFLVLPSANYYNGFYPKKKKNPTRMVQFGCKPNKPYMPYASMYLLVLTIIVLILTICNILMIRLRVNCTHSASAWQVGVI